LGLSGSSFSSRLLPFPWVNGAVDVVALRQLSRVQVMILDFPVRTGLRILGSARPVDFRRGMDSLSTLAKETLAIGHPPAISLSSERNLRTDCCCHCGIWRSCWFSFLAVRVRLKPVLNRIQGSWMAMCIIAYTRDS
jgi:hypothetical protein